MTPNPMTLIFLFFQFNALRSKFVAFQKSCESEEGAFGLLEMMESESDSRVIERATAFHARCLFVLGDLTGKFDASYRDITQPYLVGITQVRVGFLS